MNTTYRNVTTSDGIPFDVAKSALQKYIRRGETEKAVQIGIRLMEFNTVSDGKAVYTNFLNRLRVIALEDTAYASPHVLLEMDMADPLRTIQILSQSLHSRFYSHVREYNKGKILPEEKVDYQLEITDPVLSLEANNLFHAIQNRTEFYYWFERIMSRDKLPQTFSRSNRPGFLIFYLLDRLPNGKELFIRTKQICADWYKTLKVKENFLCCLHPIYMYLCLTTFARGFVAPLERSFSKTDLELDWYVYDMHTRHGKMYGRNESDFAIEGSLVAFEKWLDLEKKDFYTKARLKQGGGAKKESKEFKFKCRAQLVTSASRPDTYFATELQTGCSVVVKGPYQEIPKMFAVTALMGLFDDINVIPNSVKLLYPDLIPGIYGTRKTLDPNKPWYFCVMRDMIGQDEYKSRTHSSKVWPETEVVDFSFFGNKFDQGTPSRMSDEALYSFIIQLAARKMFGIGDFAARNFLRVGDKVYNLDIENVEPVRTVRNEFKIAKAEKEVLERFLKRNQERVKNTLKKWGENRNGIFLAKQVFNLDLNCPIGFMINDPTTILA